MDLQLEGKIAVVTGATKGIGLAVTRTLLQEGAHVVASSRSRTPEFDALADAHPDLIHVAADLTDPAAPAEIIARAIEHFGGLDILVNNAGGPPPGAKMPTFGFLDLTDDEWHAMLDFNLASAVRACRAAIPILIERGGGAIVNVTSGHARQPSAINVHYGAAKAALTNLTKALSEEFGPQGVRVNSVCPGPVNTPWWTEEGGAADIIAAHTGADRATLMTTTAPQMMALATGRLAEPQEIADAVVLLASPRSGSTTGADFVVDSGFLKAS
jgi:NAD(P)-dependent dehydrogenase (short-subunit alcohol dehydrogenase family)